MAKVMGRPVEISVLGKAVRLLQPVKGFRTSLDSIMLAAACMATEGESVFDMGCGVGGAAFCLLHRVESVYVTGIDIQPDYVDLAERNAALNGRENHTEFFTGDIFNFTANKRFDHVICNPPFLEAGHHTPSPTKGLATARGHEVPTVSVEDWINAGFHLLKSGGSFTVIHRADAVDRIIRTLGRRFGATEIIPLWPRHGVAAKRVIVRAVKDRKTPARIHPGIILHTETNTYTEEADGILMGGAAI